MQHYAALYVEKSRNLQVKVCRVQNFCTWSYWWILNKYLMNCGYSLIISSEFKFIRHFVATHLIGLSWLVWHITIYRDSVHEWQSLVIPCVLLSLDKTWLGYNVSDSLIQLYKKYAKHHDSATSDNGILIMWQSPCITL